MNKQEIYDLLDSKNISYEVVEHIPIFTMEEASKIEMPYTDLVAKNLFIRDDKKRNYYLLSMKGDRNIHLKEFKETFHTRSLSFASENDLMKILGLVKGAVTPFGLLNDTEMKVQFFIDESFIEGKIGVHPNDNSATVFLETKDLIQFIKEHGNTVIQF